MKQVEQRMFRDDKGELTSANRSFDLRVVTGYHAPRKVTHYTARFQSWASWKKILRASEQGRATTKSPCLASHITQHSVHEGSRTGSAHSEGKGSVTHRKSLHLGCSSCRKAAERRSDDAFPWAPPGKPRPFLAPRRAKRQKEKEGIRHYRRWRERWKLSAEVGAGQN